MCVQKAESELGRLNTWPKLWAVVLLLATILTGISDL